MLLTLMWFPSLRRYRTTSKMDRFTQLTDRQWALIEDLFPWEPPCRRGGRPKAPPRACLEGILWVLRSGARWKEASSFRRAHSEEEETNAVAFRSRFPSPSTCWRRLKEWTESGLFEEAWRRLLEKLDRRGRIRSHRSHRGRDVFPGKKGGARVGKTKRGKGSKLMLLVDGHTTPLAVNVHSASPAEVTLIEPLLDQAVLQHRQPERLIYDKAADSDPLRERLWRERLIELVTPHRKKRKKPATQDGRKLRRYRKRWKVERTIAWLQNFRRLVVRYEYYPHLFHGFIQLACAFTILKRF